MLTRIYEKFTSHVSCAIGVWSSKERFVSLLERKLCQFHECTNVHGVVMRVEDVDGCSHLRGHLSVHRSPPPSEYGFGFRQ